MKKILFALFLGLFSISSFADTVKQCKWDNNSYVVASQSDNKKSIVNLVGYGKCVDCTVKVTVVNAENQTFTYAANIRGGKGSCDVISSNYRLLSVSSIVCQEE